MSFLIMVYDSPITSHKNIRVFFKFPSSIWAKLSIFKWNQYTIIWYSSDYFEINIYSTIIMWCYSFWSDTTKTYTQFWRRNFFHIPLGILHMHLHTYMVVLFCSTDHKNNNSCIKIYENKCWNHLIRGFGCW